MENQAPLTGRTQPSKQKLFLHVQLILGFVKVTVRVGFTLESGTY